MNQMQTSAVQLRPKLLDELLYLAKIPSSIGHKSGIKSVTKYVEKELISLGFQNLSYIKSLPPKYAPTLIAQSNPEASLKIILVCHADTVVAPASSIDFVIDNDILEGPGVADNKGGIVVLLESLRRM
ncbi:MAG: hypothetical protein KDD37_11275, partial [Bdellovibrionales bacterium]|nr:hypothetical protein [Bdellovibrionales bacterium]